MEQYFRLILINVNYAPTLPLKGKIWINTVITRLQRWRFQQNRIHPVEKWMPQVLSHIKPWASLQKVRTFVDTLHPTWSWIRSEHAGFWAHVYIERQWETSLLHTFLHRQTWLYFGTLLCGERCEGLEGLNGVDFAVNLQSLYTLTAASLIIYRGPPIIVENKGWGG